MNKTNIEYYAQINDNIIHWYNTDIYNKKDIPNPNIKVTKEQWQEALSINANYYNPETKTFEYKDFRTTDEKIEQEKALKIQQAKDYLVTTEWVENYYIKHQLKIEAIDNNSSKWDLINKREEYKSFLRSI